jgi:hypothetical protein
MALMRMVLALTAVLFAIALPATAQNATTKTKAQPPRTYLESLDMSSSEAAMRGFVDAYAEKDFFGAYFFLSPEAKQAIATRVLEFNEAQLIPGMSAGGALSGPADAGLAGPDNVIMETWLDGAVMFDRLMRNAEMQAIKPFDFEPGAFASATMEQDDQGRFLVEAKGQTDVVFVSTVKLGNGDWRVSRVEWGQSDPDATPWGFK